MQELGQIVGEIPMETSLHDRPLGADNRLAAVARNGATHPSIVDQAMPAGRSSAPPSDTAQHVVPKCAEQVEPLSGLFRLQGWT